MPDITKCKGDGCPLKDKCWRYTSQPSEYRQSWFVESPYREEKCEHYWKKEKRRRGSK